MKKIMRVLEITLKCLEKEWEQSGESKYIVQITKEDAKMVLSELYRFEKEKHRMMEHVEEIPFREILALEKENYVALRLGRKCEKAYKKMRKKGHAAGIINLDQEENEILYTVLPEFER